MSRTAATMSACRLFACAALNGWGCTAAVLISYAKGPAVKAGEEHEQYLTRNCHPERADKVRVEANLGLDSILTPFLRKF